MSIEIVAQLKELRLLGMASSWPELIARARHHALDPEQLMAELIHVD